MSVFEHTILVTVWRMIKGQKEWRQGNHLRGVSGVIVGGEKGGELPTLVVFYCFKLLGWNACQNILKQQVGTSLLVGCTVGESGQKHSFSPKITQAFCGRDRGHANIFSCVLKTWGDLFWKKGRRGLAVPRRRMERIAGPCYKELRLPYLLRNFCPVISLNIGFSLENSQHWPVLLIRGYSGWKKTRI